MKLKLLILFAILIVILFGVFFYFIKPIGYTPPSIAPKPPQLLDVYGKLLEYNVLDSITQFKIETEIRNYKINRTILEVEANNTIKNCCYRDSLGNQMSLGPKYDVNKIVFSVEDLKVGEIYCLSWGFCGKLIEIFDTGETSEFAHNKGFVLKFDHYSEDIIVGDDYAFYFWKRNEKDVLWEFPYISTNLVEYQEKGKLTHENDLLIDQLTATEDDEEKFQPNQTRAVRILTTYIVPGEITELNIEIINKQDNDLSYQIANVKLVDENILQPYLRQCNEGEEEYQKIVTPAPVSQSGEPRESTTELVRVCTKMPYEERLKNSTLNCSIDFDSSQNTIAAKSSKLVTFKVLCSESIKCSTMNCNLILLGDFEFLDELGNRHSKSNEFFKQFLTFK